MSKRKQTPDFINKNAEDLRYLAACGIHEQRPDVGLVLKMDLEGVYNLSCFHQITGLCYYALGSVEAELQEALKKAKDQETLALLKEWQQKKDQAIRKNLLLDIERERLFAFCEEKGIWYMPLKGIVMKDLYPQPGMRQMADNDILFDPAGRKLVHDWFCREGYKAESYDVSNHDVYMKEPLYNFEMHVSLVSSLHKPHWVAYYKDVENRLLFGLAGGTCPGSGSDSSSSSGSGSDPSSSSDPGSCFSRKSHVHPEHGWEPDAHTNRSQTVYTDVGNHQSVSSYARRFSDEDFYIYLILHAYKHYYLGGTGLRSYLDFYVYLSAMEEHLDMEYVASQCELLQIRPFFETSRSLCKKIFDPDFSMKTNDPNESLTSAEWDMLQYTLSSGTYGTTLHRVNNTLDRMEAEADRGQIVNKLAYVIKRLYPDKEFITLWCKIYAPIFVRHPVLMPLAPLYRFCTKGLTRIGEFMEEILFVIKH